MGSICSLRKQTSQYCSYKRHISDHTRIFLTALSKGLNVRGPVLGAEGLQTNKPYTRHCSYRWCGREPRSRE